MVVVNKGRGDDEVVLGDTNDVVRIKGGNNVVNAGGGRNTVITRNGADTITTGDGRDIIWSGGGNDVIDAGGGLNVINSGHGNDIVTTGNERDIIRSGAGDDIVSSGSGNDIVLLGAGDDTAIFVWSENGSARNHFKGQSGHDTLRVVLTVDEAQDAVVLADLAAFEAYLAAGSRGTFRFGDLNLAVNRFEALDIRAPVIAVDDQLSLTENEGPVTLNVLSNDIDLLAGGVQLPSGNSALFVKSHDASAVPLGATLSITPEGVLTFDPGTAYDDLVAGETTDLVLSYVVADDQGFEDTATVTLTITGTNDAPVFQRDISIATTGDGEALLDLSTVVDDPDGSQNDVPLAYAITSTPGVGGASIDGTTFHFDPGDQFAHLGEGETALLLFDISATDTGGAVSEGQVGVTVNGTNDAPTVSIIPYISFIETSNPGLQTLSSSDLVTFDDIDTGDLVDISLQFNGDIAREFGPIDPAVAASLIAGFQTGAVDATPGQTPWTYHAAGLDLDFLHDVETLSWSYTIIATDSHGATGTARFDISIEGENDAPEIRPFVFIPTFGPIEMGQEIPDILPRNPFVDPEGINVTYSAIGLPDGLSIDPDTGAMTGTIAGTNSIGHHSIQIIGTDNLGATASYSAGFDILPPPPPEASADAFTAISGYVLDGDLILNDDVPRLPDGSLASGYSVALTENVAKAHPSWGDLTILENGTFIYVADAMIRGTDQFAYTITGPGGVQSTAVATVTILPASGHEIAGAVDLGPLDRPDIILSGGGVQSLSFTVPITQLVAASSGDAEDVVDRLDLFQRFSISGSQSAQLYDPATFTGSYPGITAHLVDDNVEIRIDPDLFPAGTDIPDTLAFNFGYHNGLVVSARVGLGSDIPLDTTSADLSVARASLSPDIDIIDDREYAPIRGAIINGQNGTDGAIGITTPYVSDFHIPTLYDPDQVPHDNFYLDRYIADFITDMAIALGRTTDNIINRFGNSLIELHYQHGQNGNEGFFPQLQAVTGTSASDVIFGGNINPAGHGGHGGRATNGVDGFVAFFNPLAVVPWFDKDPGANGGHGGHGSSMSYTINAGEGHNTIIGGAGGPAGDGGDGGASGNLGMLSVPEAALVGANGGIGGNGGWGGWGGSITYSVTAGSGDDTIHGANAGNAGAGGDGGDAGDGGHQFGIAFAGVDGGRGGSGGASLYTIDAGAGDDIVHAGNGGHAGIGGTQGRGALVVENKGHPGSGGDGGSSLYSIKTGSGNDVIHGGNAGNGGRSPGGLRSGEGGSATYHIESGAGDDTITGGKAGARFGGGSTYHIDAGSGDDHVTYGGVVDYQGFMNGLSPSHSNSGIASYHILGGADDDTIEFLPDAPYLPAHESFLDLKVDGGEGYDTVVLPRLWKVVGFEIAVERNFDHDFLAGDTFTEIERFILGQDNFSTRAFLSAASARSVSESPDMIPGVASHLLIEGAGDVSLGLVDDAAVWQSAGTTTIDGDPYSTFFNDDELVFLHTKNVDVEILNVFAT